MFMQDLPPQVEAVQVAPARLPAAASEAAYSVIRLDQTDLEGRERLDQALSQAPGASLFRRNDSLAANPTTQGMSLRSIAPSGAGRALVTLDGVPQNDPFGGWVIWASLPPELIQEATVIRGGGVGPYGAGALTGTVELNELSRPGMVADARYAERSTSHESLVYEASSDRADFMIAGAGGHTAGYVPVRQGAGAADTPLKESDWSAATRVNLAIADGTLSTRLFAYDEKRLSGRLGEAARARGQGASVTYARAPGQSSLGFRLQGWVRASDLANSSFSVAPNRQTTTPANEQYETPATGYGFNAAVRGGSADREWEVGADMRSATGETHEHFSYNAAQKAFTRNRIAGGDTLVAGGYAEGSLKRDAYLFTGGVRVDYWASNDAKRLETQISNGAVLVDSAAPDRDGWLPTARAGVVRSFDNDYFVRGAAYMGFRNPTINELHRPFRVGNDITEANPGLKPERLWGVEAAIGRERERWSLNATVFYNELADAVTNVTVALPPPGGGVIPSFPIAGFVPANGVLRQRQNAGVISAWGIEADGSRRWTDTLSTRFAISYTDAEVDGGTSAPQLTGLRPAQAPELTTTSSIEWRPLQGLSIIARHRYETSRWDDDLNTRKLEAARVIDLRLGYEVREGIEVYLDGENIFDEDVQTARTADGIVSYGPPSTVGIGISIRR